MNRINKENSNKRLDTKNRLTVAREDVGDGMKDGKGFNQRTFMHNPWMQTTIWGLAWGGERRGLGGDGEREKKREQL